MKLRNGILVRQSYQHRKKQQSKRFVKVDSLDWSTVLTLPAKSTAPVTLSYCPWFNINYYCNPLFEDLIHDCNCYTAGKQNEIHKYLFYYHLSSFYSFTNEIFRL